MKAQLQYYINVHLAMAVNNKYNIKKTATLYISTYNILPTFTLYNSMYILYIHRLYIYIYYIIYTTRRKLIEEAEQGK